MRPALCVLLLSGVAHAHTGGTAVNATFTQPAAPTLGPGDLSFMVAPYTFATADTTFTVSWDDGDTDPTGHFTFYYLDHQPTFGVTPADVESIATPIREVGKPTELVQIWASCTCMDVGGVMCPDLGAPRDCRSSFVW